MLRPELFIVHPQCDPSRRLRGILSLAFLCGRPGPLLFETDEEEQAAAAEALEYLQACFPPGYAVQRREDGAVIVEGTPDVEREGVMESPKGPRFWLKPGQRVLTQEDTEQTLREYCRSNGLDYDEVVKPWSWLKPKDQRPTRKTDVER